MSRDYRRKPPVKDGRIGQCPLCGKVRFRSRKAAKDFIRENHPGHHLRPYECEDEDGNLTGYWHYGHLPALVIQRGASKPSSQHRVHLHQRRTA